MPAYLRGEISLEAYLVRILAALCRVNGGELRIKGELVDAINEPTTLLKDWDTKTQELVLRTHMGSFGEVFKVVPEKQVAKETIVADPVKRQAEASLSLPFKGGTSLDDARLAELEKTLDKRRIARKLQIDLQERRQTEAQ